MDVTIFVILVGVTLIVAHISWSLTQALKGIERRLVAIEERVSNLEDELARAG